MYVASKIQTFDLHSAHSAHPPTHTWGLHEGSSVGYKGLQLTEALCISSKENVLCLIRSVYDNKKKTFPPSSHPSPTPTQYVLYFEMSALCLNRSISLVLPVWLLPSGVLNLD